MLQDVEAGEPIEIEALVGAVVELGRLTETPTPHIDAVYALREPARQDDSPTPRASCPSRESPESLCHTTLNSVQTGMTCRNHCRVAESRRRRRTGAQLARRRAAHLSRRCARSSPTSTASLASQGIGPGDRVGIVLDNGPEMAAAFLAIGSAATAAPLNPTYRADEFEFYLTDLRAKLLVVARGQGFAGDRRRAEARRSDRATRRASGAGRGHLLARVRRRPRTAAPSPCAPRRRTTSRSCCTRRARRRGRRSCRSRTRTSARRPRTSARRSRSRRTIATSSSCRCSTSTA